MFHNQSSIKRDKTTCFGPNHLWTSAGRLRVFTPLSHHNKMIQWVFSEDFYKFSLSLLVSITFSWLTEVLLEFCVKDVKNKVISYSFDSDYLSKKIFYRHLKTPTSSLSYCFLLFWLVYCFKKRYQLLIIVTVLQTEFCVVLRFQLQKQKWSVFM